MLVNRFDTEEGVTILRLSGKLVASTIDPLKGSLDVALTGEGGHTVINFECVDIVDSVAVGLLVSRWRTASKKNISLAFCQASLAVMEMVEETANGDSSPQNFETENAAVEAVQLLIEKSEAN